MFLGGSRIELLDVYMVGNECIRLMRYGVAEDVVRLM